MYQLIVGMGTCGISAGAKNTYDKLSALLNESDIKASLSITGCIGMCYKEPLVELRTDKERFIYGDVTPKIAEDILNKHINDGKILDDNLILRLPTNKWQNLSGAELNYQQDQHRIVLRNCGTINPEHIEEYEARDGYKALKKVLSLKPEDVIEEVKQSGLRGRGGGGFPTGLKWSFCAKSVSDTKYVICNADEGDPGAFMDRSVLEGDPHSVLEGMAICGYAIGASYGYIYCRAEYPLAIERLRKAIKQAQDKKYLSDNIMGSKFSFNIEIKQGAGAFVCGEETALMKSIEGDRGMPRIRPPFPAIQGLWKSPTNINNVETFANIPWIIINSGKKYSSVGTETSKGTKVFALAGKIKRGGLVEVPMGIKIKDIVFNIGGGIKEDRQFKAVQMGGPSGGCIPSSLGETEIDYENVTKTGAIMGSGGLVVMDETTCMVEMARFFLEFTQKESCGKCTFCRIGTLRMLEILERITKGEGHPEDLDTLDMLAHQIKDSSLCGLGQTAPNPVLTTLKYFREEYEAHINDHKCPAKSCGTLVDYIIDKDKCTGCTVCAKACPSNAIHGERKHPFEIDQQACIKCGKCITVCNFNAIYKD